MDDVVEPEDEDYIDATEGWYISSVAYVYCVIFILQMKSLVFLFFFLLTRYWDSE